MGTVDWEKKQKELDEESIISLRERKNTMAVSRLKGMLREKKLEIKQMESFIFLNQMEIKRLNVEKVRNEKKVLSSSKEILAIKQNLSEIERKIALFDEEHSKIRFEYKRVKDKLIRAQNELKNLKSKEIGIERSVSQAKRISGPYSASSSYDTLKLEEVKREVLEKNMEISNFNCEVGRLGNLLSSEAMGSLRLRTSLRIQTDQLVKIENSFKFMVKRLENIELDIDILVEETRILGVKKKILEIEISKLEYTIKSKNIPKKEAPKIIV